MYVRPGLDSRFLLGGPSSGPRLPREDWAGWHHIGGSMWSTPGIVVVVIVLYFKLSFKLPLCFELCRLYLKLFYVKPVL